MKKYKTQFIFESTLSLILHCLFIFYFDEARTLFTSGELIEMTWYGYLKMKWITLVIAFLEIRLFHRNKDFEKTLLDGTRYLIPKTNQLQNFFK